MKVFLGTRFTGQTTDVGDLFTLKKNQQLQKVGCKMLTPLKQTSKMLPFYTTPSLPACTCAFTHIHAWLSLHSSPFSHPLSALSFWWFPLFLSRTQEGPEAPPKPLCLL